MHILKISSSPYLHPETPLWGMFQRDQLNALRDAGHKVGLMSPLGRSAKKLSQIIGGQQADSSDPLVFKNHQIDWLSWHKTLQSYRCVSIGLKMFTQYVKQHGLPDIIHAHNAVHAGILAAAIKAKTDIPYVVTEHSSWVAKGQYTGTMAKRIQQAYAGAYKRIAVSGYLANQMSIYTDDVAVVPNMLDEVFLQDVDFANARDDGMNDKACINLINVASLDDNKNQAFLFHVVAYLKAEGHDVRLTIIGDGPNKDKLIALSRELSCDNQVQMLGRLPREEVRAQLLGNDVFCLASYVETFGVVAIEANACGLPVVSLACGGIYDIIDQPMLGEVLDSQLEQPLAQRVAAYAQSILTFAGNADAAKKNEIASLTTQRYSPSAIATQLTEIYAK